MRYQEEAKRQGDVRHGDAYDNLSENVKELDRALVRYVRHLVIEEKEQSCLEEQQRIVHVVEAMKMSGRSDDKMHALSYSCAVFYKLRGVCSQVSRLTTDVLTPLPQCRTDGPDFLHGLL
jgi:hypothetical protein